MKRLWAPLVVGLAVLYLILAVTAAGCLAAAGVAVQPQSSHHHHSPSSHVAHSAVCAWACQANPTVAAVVDAPQAAGLQFFVVVTLITMVLLTRLSARVPESRGPPSATSII